PHKRVQIPEFPVHRCETDVGYFVQFPQALHHPLADLPGGDFRFPLMASLPLHEVDDSLQLLHGNRPFLTRFDEPLEYVAAVERLAASVLLNDDERGLLPALVRGKPPPAGFTLPPPANGGAIVGCPGIEHLAFRSAAIWAPHAMRILPPVSAASTVVTIISRRIHIRGRKAGAPNEALPAPPSIPGRSERQAPRGAAA